MWIVIDRGLQTKMERIKAMKTAATLKHSFSFHKIDPL